MQEAAAGLAGAPAVGATVAAAEAEVGSERRWHLFKGQAVEPRGAEHRVNLLGAAALVLGQPRRVPRAHLRGSGRKQIPQQGARARHRRRRAHEAHAQLRGQGSVENREKIARSLKHTLAQ